MNIACPKVLDPKPEVSITPLARSEKEKRTERQAGLPGGINQRAEEAKPPIRRARCRNEHQFADRDSLLQKLSSFRDTIGNRDRETVLAEA
jgi:hypothetical protein